MEGEYSKQTKTGPCVLCDACDTEFIFLNASTQFYFPLAEVCVTPTY